LHKIKIRRNRKAIRVGKLNKSIKMRPLKHLQILLCSLFLLTIVGCQKQPLASFTVSTNSIGVGKTIVFTNTSVDADTYVWDFGDGGKSTLTSPTHIYTLVGTFSVTLTASSKNGEKKDIATTSITVNNSSEVTINGTKNIYVDLGATDADVLENVSATNGQEVIVSGLNYDYAGAQLATFQAGNISVKDSVRIKTDKLAGDYEFTSAGDYEIYEATVTQSTTIYNKIIIVGITNDEGIEVICTNNTLTVVKKILTYDDITGTLTGTGTFEKIGNDYQIKTMTFTVIWSDGEMENYVYMFEKE